MEWIDEVVLVALLQGSAIGWPGDVSTVGGITILKSVCSACLAFRRSHKLFRLAKFRGVSVGEDSGLATSTNPLNAFFAETVIGSLINVSI